MTTRRLMALVLCGLLPAWSMAAPLETGSFGAPVTDQALSNYRGARDITFNLQDTEAQLYNNQAIATMSGTNQVAGSALANSSGMSTVIQNSGNNVVIQSATIVNVKLQ